MPSQKKKKSGQKKLSKQVGVGLFNVILINSVNFIGNIFLVVFFKEKLDISPQSAYAMMIIVLFCVNFLLFRYVVYKSRKMGFQKQFLRYFVATVAIRVIEFLAFAKVENLVDDYRLAVVIVTIGATTLRFIFYKYTVFKK